MNDKNGSKVYYNSSDFSLILQFEDSIVKSKKMRIKKHDFLAQNTIFLENKKNAERRRAFFENHNSKSNFLSLTWIVLFLH